MKLGKTYGSPLKPDVCSAVCRSMSESPWRACRFFWKIVANCGNAFLNHEGSTVHSAKANPVTNGSQLSLSCSSLRCPVTRDPLPPSWEVPFMSRMNAAWSGPGPSIGMLGDCPWAMSLSP
jgi:hypothetical protein